MAEFYILRHGETVWNRDGRMQGGLDSPLTARGVAQARRQGEILRAAGAGDLPVWSSPQGRALETARLALPGSEPVAEVRLSEVAMGAWQGLTFDEIARRCPEAATDPASFQWKFSAPGGERLEQMLARVRSFLADVRGPAVIVTHGVTAQILRGRLLGLDVEGSDALGDRQGVVYRVRDGRERVLGA